MRQDEVQVEGFLRDLIDFCTKFPSTMFVDGIWLSMNFHRLLRVTFVCLFVFVSQYWHRHCSTRMPFTNLLTANASHTFAFASVCKLTGIVPGSYLYNIICTCLSYISLSNSPLHLIRKPLHYGSLIPSI